MLFRMQKPKTLEKVLATRLNEDARWALKRASLHRSKSDRLFGDGISAYDPQLPMYTSGIPLTPVFGESRVTQEFLRFSGVLN
jgi:hypothetical protein